jgi:RNase H-like domain found in reverse transcriptase
LNPAQTQYTTTERELLAIVETLKEFRNILLGHTICIFTDHQNLTYKNFNTERVMRWCLLIEEFGPELIYIKGISNVVADALSRLNITLEPMSHDQTVVVDLYGATAKDIMFPITFSNP